MGVESARRRLLPGGSSRSAVDGEVEAREASFYSGRLRSGGGLSAREQNSGTARSRVHTRVLREEEASRRGTRGRGGGTRGQSFEGFTLSRGDNASE